MLSVPTRGRAFPSPFCLLPSAFCLLPSAFCLLPSAFCLLPSHFSLLISPFSLLPSYFSLRPTNDVHFPGARIDTNSHLLICLCPHIDEVSQATSPFLQLRLDRPS